MEEEFTKHRIGNLDINCFGKENDGSQEANLSYSSMLNISCTTSPIQKVIKEITPEITQNLECNIFQQPNLNIILTLPELNNIKDISERVYTEKAKKLTSSTYKREKKGEFIKEYGNPKSMLTTPYFVPKSIKGLKTENFSNEKKEREKSVIKNVPVTKDLENS